MLTEQDGSAPLDAVFGIVILMLLALGTMQIALTLYAHNAVRASAYEAARAAAEIGATGAHARSVALQTVAGTAGGLVEGIRISLSRRAAPEGPVVFVEITGRQRAIGPIPLAFPIDVTASSLVEELPR